MTQLRQATIYDVPAPPPAPAAKPSAPTAPAVISRDMYTMVTQRGMLELFYRNRPTHKAMPRRSKRIGGGSR